MPSKKLLWLLPIIILTACGSGERPYGGESAAPLAAAAASDNESADSVPADLGSINSPNRKMIRTVDFQCKVPDVLRAVTVLEKKVANLGGMVAESHIDNSGGELSTLDYKPDSLKQVQIYRTTATLTLRVPATMLDSLSDLIPELSDFVVSRNLSQHDMTTTYLANQLRNKTGQLTDGTTKAQLAARNTDVIVAANYEDARNEKYIARQIGNLQLLDNVSYATLTVGFSQPDRTFIQTVANPGYTMRVPFATRCSVAWQGGLDLLEYIFVGLLAIWPLLLVLSSGLLIGFTLMKQRKKTAAMSIQQN
jgi:hypothetical protein